MRLTLTFDSATADEMVTIVEAAAQTRITGGQENPECTVRQMGQAFTVTIGPIPPDQAYRIALGLQAYNTERTIDETWDRSS